MKSGRTPPASEMSSRTSILGVDLDAVWVVVERDIPELKKRVTEILSGPDQK